VSTTSSGQGENGPGKRIHDLRIARNMTQREVAAGKYSVSYISAIEREKISPPSRHVLEWCADQLGVSVAELLGESRVKPADESWMRQQLSRRAYEQIYAQMLITVGEVEEGLKRARRVRRDGTATTERPLIWFSAYGSAQAGELDEALKEAETYRLLAEEAHDARDMAAHHLLLGYVALATGDSETAHLELARALDAEPVTVADPEAVQAIRRALAAALRARRDPAQAHQVVTDALRDYELFASPEKGARWLRARAEEAAGTGEFERAYQFIRRAWNGYREAAFHRHAAEMYLRHATYVGDDMPPEQREAELRRAALLSELTEGKETHVLAGAYLAQLLAARGALALAEEVIRLAVPNGSADSGAPINDERSIALGLAHGWMAAASGEADTARRLAEDVDAALDTPPDFARTSAEYAGQSLSRLFERLQDEDRAFVALKRATSQQGWLRPG